MVELGDGTTTQRNTPVDVSGLASDVTALAAGSYYTCAVMDAVGGVRSWGSDGSGQLGIGTITQRLTPVAVVESVAPQLTINYMTGQPDSYFTFTGWNFPVSSTVAIAINDYVFPVTVPVNATGSFIFFLDTTNADAGGYFVTASVISSAAETGLSQVAASANPSAVSVFMLDDSAPLHLQSGGGQTLTVPAGIAVQLHWVYLPLVAR